MTCSVLHRRLSDVAIRKSLLPPSPWIIEHHDCRIERVRIEWPAEPLPHLFVIRMLRVADGEEKLFIATDAAAVLGRAGASTVDAPRIVSRRVARHQALVNQFVFPVVAEVVQ